MRLVSRLPVVVEDKLFARSDVSVDASLDRQLTTEMLASEHILVCTLGELARRVQHIGTSVQPLFVEAQGEHMSVANGNDRI
jgi:hypothetical protein